LQELRQKNEMRILYKWSYWTVLHSNTFRTLCHLKAESPIALGL